MTAPITMWVAERPDAEVRAALERLASSEDVQRIAVMPDVHLASGVCIGTVTATTHRIFPAAVGGDISCGVAAVRFEAKASLLDSAEHAAAVLAGLYRVVPFIKHARRDAPALPDALEAHPLSTPALEALKHRDGRLQLGTLGRGNHFLELQRDEGDSLWLMVHSGSRAMGPAVREHHVRGAPSDSGLTWLDASAEAGASYLSDMQWARAYARHNRRLMAERVSELLSELHAARADWDSLVDCDHNHVTRETIDGRELWIHRKGALRASAGEPGVIPGSMGSASYHVVGRGEASALCSSSHGAGRAMSRTDARRRITSKRLLADVRGVWFDHRLTERLREEAPAAYKDISAVMRAQRELTRIVRKLEPLLVYKGA
jgi:tRNA-splicing ligase RtcB